MSIISNSPRQNDLPPSGSCHLPPAPRAQPFRFALRQTRALALMRSRKPGGPTTADRHRPGPDLLMFNSALEEVEIASPILQRQTEAQREEVTHPASNRCGVSPRLAQCRAQDAALGQFLSPRREASASKSNLARLSPSACLSIPTLAGPFCARRSAPAVKPSCLPAPVGSAPCTPHPGRSSHLDPRGTQPAPWHPKRQHGDTGYVTPSGLFFKKMHFHFQTGSADGRGSKAAASRRAGREAGKAGSGEQAWGRGGW